MAESAYAVVSKTIGSNPVWVQVPLKPPNRSSPLPSPKANEKESQSDQPWAKTDPCKKKSKFTHFLTQYPASNSYVTETKIITGRRSGLKIRRPLRSWGFDPPSRHHNNTIKFNVLALIASLNHPSYH